MPDHIHQNIFVTRQRIWQVIVMTTQRAYPGLFLGTRQLLKIFEEKGLKH